MTQWRLEPVRRTCGLLVALLVTVSFGSAGAGLVSLDEATTTAEACADRVPRTPILVSSDEGFTVEDPVTGTEVPDPASGVVGGEGTPEDPYLISGWCITGAGDPFRLVNNVQLLDTSAHVVIEDNVIVGSSEVAGGILLWEAENVVVQDNRIRNVNIAVMVGDHGAQSPDNTVRANTIDAAGAGVLLNDGPRALVEDNEIRAEKDGIWASADSEDVVIQGNAIHAETARILETPTQEDGDDGIGGSGSGVIANNTITGYETGIAAWGTTLVENNTVRQTEEGIVFAQQPTIRFNDVQDNDVGLRVPQKGAGVSLHHNNVADNTVGLQVEDEGYDLDARDNWWGAASGPSGGLQDTCSDEVASGEGDELVTEGPGICFHPWLEAPNPEAGAG